MTETGATGPAKRFPLRNALYFLFSLATTVGIFSYLLRSVRPGDVIDLLKNVNLWAVAAFVVLSLTQSIFRLWRYKVLLRLSGYSPSSLALFLVVLVRNFFSDLLPARIGTLIYVYMVNSRLGVPFAAAASSFSLSFIFDFIVLAPMIVLAVVAAGAVGEMSPAVLIGGAVALLVVTVVVLFLLPQCFRLAAATLERMPLIGAARRAKWGAAMRSVEGEIHRAQKAGVYLRVLALSFMVRVGKYGSYYVFLYALLAPLGYTWAQLDLPRAFLGFCAAEMAASLPISGIAGFGAYEGTWSLAFHLLGYPENIAKLTSISHHLFTQVYGYGLGALALIVLLMPYFRREQAPPGETAARDRPAMFYLKVAVLTALLLGLAFALCHLPSIGARGDRKVAKAEKPTPAEVEARAAFAREFGGAIVFDSDRSGSFGIWAMQADGRGLRPVSDTPAHEMYPDPSPDGAWIAFSRAPSLSKRAVAEIWVCRAAGGEERKLADNGMYPTFSADGQTVFFERERSRVMAVGLDGAGEREVFPAKSAWPGSVQIVKPRISADGGRVAFVSNRGQRGGWNTWIADLKTGESWHAAKGCEPGWTPDGRLTWVNEGDDTRERTGIFLYDPAAGKSVELQDADAPRGHEYFPTVTPDGAWLLWGACGPGEHEHVSSNYQLFARRLSGGAPVRLTFDGFDNRWPKRLPEPAANKPKAEEQAGGPASG